MTSRLPIIILALFALAGVTALVYFRSDIEAAITLNKSANSLEDGLVGHWSFDEDAGTTVPDHSGNGNTGTATNGPTGTTGQLGRALSFDGSNDYVSAGTAQVFPNEGQAHSASFWIYKTNSMTDTSAEEMVINLKNNDAGVIGYFRTTGSNLRMAYGHRDGLTAGNMWDISTTDYTNLFLNKWAHVTFVYDGGTITSAASYKWYYNGVEQTSFTKETTLIGGTTVTNYIGVDNDAASLFLNGVLDDVRIYNRALSQAEITRLYHSAGSGKQGVVPSNNLKNGLVGYWTFDMDAGATEPDRSGQGNNGTLTAGPTGTTGQLGRGLKFDGTDDYVSVADNSTLTFGTGDFSWAVWVKSAVTPSTRKPIMGSDSCAADTSCLELFSGTNAGSNGWEFTINTVNAAFTETVVADTWYQISLVRQSGTTYFYRNGQLLGTSAILSGVNFDLPGLSFGRYSFASTFLNGSVDDVRIYNRALSATEVKQLYNVRPPKISASPTSRLTSGLVGYWTFDGQDTAWSSATAGTVTDRSGNGNTGTLTSMNQATSPVIGIHGQALNFDGSDDYIDAGSGSSLDITDTVTLSAWVKTNSIGSRQTIVCKGNYQVGTGVTYEYQIETSGKIQFDIKTGGTDGVDGILGNTILSAGTWYNVVVTFNSSTDATNIYINGVLDKSATVTGTPPSKPTEALYIGRLFHSSAFQTFNGSIDDVRIYNRALSASEVSQLYNMGR